MTWCYAIVVVRHLHTRRKPTTVCKDFTQCINDNTEHRPRVQEYKKETLTQYSFYVSIYQPFLFLIDFCSKLQLKINSSSTSSKCVLWVGDCSIFSYLHYWKYLHLFVGNLVLPNDKVGSWVKIHKNIKSSFCNTKHINFLNQLVREH